jgi:hypothetical protein
MIALVLASLCGFVGGDAAGPVAMVLSAKGTITLQRGQAAPVPAAPMTLLHVGDQLSAAADGEATLIFLGDGQRERLMAKAQAQVGVKGCTPAAAVERVAGPKLAPANLESLRELAKSSRGAVGVLRGEAPLRPQVVTPLYGATVPTDRPALTWPDVKAEAYLVELFSGRDGPELERLWKATSPEPRLSYPAKEKPLQRGLLYRWRVTPLKGQEAAGEPIVDSKFLVLTGAEIKRLAALKPLLVSKDPADLLLAAVSFEAHGVYDEALHLYERLAELSPDVANFQVALASYYGRAGRTDLAAQAWGRARQLGVARRSAR